MKEEIPHCMCSALNKASLPKSAESGTFKVQNISLRCLARLGSDKIDNPGPGAWKRGRRAVSALSISGETFSGQNSRGCCGGRSLMHLAQLLLTLACEGSRTTQGE